MNAPERPTSSGEATTTSSAETVAVASSLEGRAILPRRVRWTVTTSLPAEKIRQVRFFVNGRRVWVDSDSPYAYGEEGAYLVTSYFHDPYWNRRGGTRFTARVVEWSGAKWNARVVARVPKPGRGPVRPSSYGAWGRLSAAALKNPPPPGEYVEYSSYTSHIYFPGGGLWVGRTSERAYAYEIWADATTLHVRTPIFFGSTDVAGNEFGWRFKGFQCAPDGPPSVYDWSFRRGRYLGRFQGKERYARYLVLEAHEEPCEPRRRILEGIWEGID